MPSPSSAVRYGVVVPVKPPEYAKSRLRPLGDLARRELVVAFAADTVAAALRCPQVGAVLAVTDDLRLARALAAQGAEVIPDGTTADLNETLRLGAAELLRRHETLAPVALCADLPALRPGELSHALAGLPGDGPGFLADADGCGTTLVGAPALESFAPRFGPESRRRHLEAGVREVTVGGVPSVRRDVDTPTDLSAAVALGVGTHTRDVLARHSL